MEFDFLALCFAILLLSHTDCLLQIHCDRTYTYPRESMDALADLGLLALIVPEEFGGLGENHVCTNMVVETIARYGCPSTALVYS